MKKKLLFAFVALLTTASAWADVWQDPETKVNYEYTVGESKASVKGSPDATGDITILQKFSVDEKEYTVTSIGNRAFKGCTGLTSVSIPSSVTTIGEYAFYECSGLTSVTIPSSVATISDYAFRECSSLTSVTIPSSVATISDYAFYNCSGLTSITIPSSVTSIGGYAFSHCSSLTSITVDAENKIFDSRGDCNAIIETATNTLLYGCSSTVIPNDVTNIGAAFFGCTGLTSITIPSSVTTIGTATFEYCI